mgnify:FL=1
MNISKIKNRVLIALTLVASIGFSACGSSSETSLSQEIQQYYDKDITAKNNTQGTSAYFDLSDGVVLAYKNPGAAGFLNATVQRLTSTDSCQVFSLADDKITPLRLKQTQLYNKIMDTKSYVQQMAPIEKTLDKIVKDGKSSLLVTDFEEFTPDRQVQHQSFATRYFTHWLKQGNDITFFIFDFVGERNLTYHLYFVVFDNKSHQFLDQIRQSVAGITGYKEFHLSTDAYSVSTQYPSAAKGGNYHDAATGEDLITGVMEDGSENAYANYGQGARLEYYPLGVTWEDALKNSQEATQAGFNPKYTALFRNLFFDFSNQDSYVIKKLNVKVTDVEEDFQCFVAKEKATAKPTEIKDMLTIDQSLFAKSMTQSQGKKAEIGIVFAPQFKGDIIGGEQGDLFRIDVTIAESQPNLSPRIDKLFSWGANNSLRDAIRNTLQELNPRGTVIYTYFAKAI